MGLDLEWDGSEPEPEEPGPSDVVIDALPAQDEFVADTTSPVVGLIGGIGSGKTEALCMKALHLAGINGNTPTLWLAPTYRIAMHACARTMLRVLARCGYRSGRDYRWFKGDMVLRLGMSEGSPEVIFISADEPDRIVAYTAGAVIMDEPALMDEEVLRKVKERKRGGGKTTVRQIAMGGTPDRGLDSWLYTELEERPKPGTRLIRARTTDNVFLPADFVPDLVRQYTPEQARAYLNGEFVNLFAGQVYSYFDTDKHCRPFTGPIPGNVIIGADFNYELCCWVVGIEMGDFGHIVGEIVGEHTNTYAMVDLAMEWLYEFFRAHDGVHLPPHEIAQRVAFHVDASSSAHKTSSVASLSDAQIIRSSGFRVIHDASNPPVKDRVNTLNNRFRLPGRILIDKEQCPRLVRALRAQVWKSGQPEKGKGHDGYTDALGYLAWYADDSSWREVILRANETDYRALRAGHRPPRGR